MKILSFQNKSIMKEKIIKPIGFIKTPYKEKFGIPRQSKRVSSVIGKIELVDKYADKDGIRDIEKFSHLWLIFGFNKAKENPSLLVRPPRLGGNKKVGVFASRSPFRPNTLGLSSVKLEWIEFDQNDKPIIVVSGVDLLDETPIYDIKPYLAYVDSHPDATDGFAENVRNYALKVAFCKELLSKIDISKQKSLIQILEQDPRPSYQNDPDREYGMRFADYEIFFKVDGESLTVTRVKTDCEAKK